MDETPQADQPPVDPGECRMRLHASGQFVVAQPAGRAIDLFTPEGERAWAPDWDPTYPAGQPSVPIPSPRSASISRVRTSSSRSNRRGSKAS